MSLIINILKEILKNSKSFLSLSKRSLMKNVNGLKNSSSQFVKKYGEKLGKFGKKVGTGAVGGLVGGIVSDKLDDSDEQGLALLTSLDKNVGEINSKIKGPSETEGRTPAARTDISAAMAATDPKLQEHSTEIKDAIKATTESALELSDNVKKVAAAMDEAKEPLGDLLKMAAPAMNLTKGGGLLGEGNASDKTNTPLQTVSGTSLSNADGVKQEITELDKVMSDYVKLWSDFLSSYHQPQLFKVVLMCSPAFKPIITINIINKNGLRKAQKKIKASFP